MWSVALIALVAMVAAMMMMMVFKYLSPRSREASIPLAFASQHCVFELWLLLAGDSR
jgi:uncharacterized membrane protein YhfC